MGIQTGPEQNPRAVLFACKCGADGPVGFGSQSWFILYVCVCAWVCVSYSQTTTLSVPYLSIFLVHPNLLNEFQIQPFLELISAWESQKNYQSPILRNYNLISESKLIGEQNCLAVEIILPAHCSERGIKKIYL